MDIFDLVAKLTLDSSKYDEGLDGAGSKASGFASKLGGGLATAAKVSAAGLMAAAGAGIAVAGAFVKGTAAVAAYGDNIDKMSQKMGMSATAYQEWDAVMQHSGTSMETLKASMKTLASAAETGKDAFDKLGISQQQIASMSQEELFSATITALQGVTNETERTYLAGQLLGRGATELGALLNTSAADTQAMKDRVHELGGVMSDESVKAAARFQDSLQDMQTAINGAKRSLAKGFLPAIADIMDGIGNVVSGFDVEGGLEQIEQGVDNFINNLNDVIPRVAEMAGRIIPAFAKAIATNLPTLAQTGLDLILHLGQGIANAIPSLIARLPAIIVGIVNFITSNLPAIVQTGVQIIGGIIQGLAQAIPQLIMTAIELLSKLGDYLINGVTDPRSDFGGKLGQIIIKIGEFLVRAIPKLAEAALKIVAGLAMLLISAAEELVKAAVKLIAKLGEALKNRAKDLAGSAKEMVNQIVNGIANKARDIVNAGKTIIANIASGIVNNVRLVTDKISNVITAIKTKITSVASSLLSSGREIVDKIASGIGNSFALVTNKFNDLKNRIKEKIESMAAWWVSFGYNIVKGIADGITKYAAYVINAITRLVSSAWEKVKDFFGIASPSKLMKWAGKMLDEGFASGISDNADQVADAMDELNGITAEPISGVLSSAGSSGSGNAPNYGGIVINIYGAEGQDVNELAEIVSRKLQTAVDRRRLTFA